MNVNASKLYANGVCPAIAASNTGPTRRSELRVNQPYDCAGVRPDTTPNPAVAFADPPSRASWSRRSWGRKGGCERRRLNELPVTGDNPVPVQRWYQDSLKSSSAQFLVLVGTVTYGDIGCCGPARRWQRGRFGRPPALDTAEHRQAAWSGSPEGASASLQPVIWLPESAVETG
jgi:hypothetical protein